jgi:hypothetical protein
MSPSSSSGMPRMFLFWLCAAAAPWAAQVETDACTLLTPVEIGAVIGVPVGAGTHLTPAFLKTCTWAPTGPAKVTAVTVNLQTTAFHDGAKQMAMKVAAATASVVKPVTVGEDGYYNVAGDLVTLWFKKGAVSAKVTVYAKLAVDSKEAMELTLAKQVAAKL